MQLQGQAARCLIEHCPSQRDRIDAIGWFLVGSSGLMLFEYLCLRHLQSYCALSTCTVCHESNVLHVQAKPLNSSQVLPILSPLYLQVCSGVFWSFPFSYPFTFRSVELCPGHSLSLTPLRLGLLRSFLVIPFLLPLFVGLLLYSIFDRCSPAATTPPTSQPSEN